MMPQRVYPERRKALPRDCMVTLDARVAPGLAYDHLRFELPRTFFAPMKEKTTEAVGASIYHTS
jgi:hypothetical protein